MATIRTVFDPFQISEFDPFQKTNLQGSGIWSISEENFAIKSGI